MAEEIEIIIIRLLLFQTLEATCHAVHFIVAGIIVSGGEGWRKILKVQVELCFSLIPLERIISFMTVLIFVKE